MICALVGYDVYGKWLSNLFFCRLHIGLDEASDNEGEANSGSYSEPSPGAEQFMGCFWHGAELQCIGWGIDRGVLLNVN